MFTLAVKLFHTLKLSTVLFEHPIYSIVVDKVVYAAKRIGRLNPNNAQNVLPLSRKI